MRVLAFIHMFHEGGCAASYIHNPAFAFTCRHDQTTIPLPHQGCSTFDSSHIPKLRSHTSYDEPGNNERKE